MAKYDKKGEGAVNRLVAIIKNKDFVCYFQSPFSCLAIRQRIFENLPNCPSALYTNDCV